MNIQITTAAQQAIQNALQDPVNQNKVFRFFIKGIG